MFVLSIKIFIFNYYIYPYATRTKSTQNYASINCDNYMLLATVHITYSRINPVSAINITGTVTSYRFEHCIIGCCTRIVSTLSVKIG